MPRRITALPAALLLALLSGCAGFEGTYTPDCIAFAGDSIKLDGGRFVWDKFTDQVHVDGRGRVIDPFPDYPVYGRYRMEDERVIFESWTGEPLPDRYLWREGRRYWLLTEEQWRNWQESGERPDCPLMLGGEEG